MHQDILVLLISAGLGTLVGLEREAGGKPAGLRTHVLVCMGSTLFVLTVRYAAETFGGQTLDPTRVIHGIVTGIGFLGAGSIIQQRGSVRGLTTASSIWMVSAIGVAVAVRAWPLAIASTVLALIVLEGLRIVERRVGNPPRQGPPGTGSDAGAA